MYQHRGFITLATGKEEYYYLAANLVKSYRLFSREPLPFAILCDRENEYTSLFDDVILMTEGVTRSYLDKLNIATVIPYDETIFIDSDCLAFGDLNELFPLFQDADDFSCLGHTLPLDSKRGWFIPENLGRFREKVSYVVGLHGGMYFMRNCDNAKAVFEFAKTLIPEYSAFRFKGNFDSPGDEPLLALVMALNKMKPVEIQPGIICCYWNHENRMDIDISVPKAIVKNTSQNNLLVHWGTRFTRGLLYQEQAEILDIIIQGDNVSRKIIRCRFIYCWKNIVEKLMLLRQKCLGKIKGVVNRKHR